MNVPWKQMLPRTAPSTLPPLPPSSSPSSAASARSPPSAVFQHQLPLSLPINLLFPPPQPFPSAPEPIKEVGRVRLADILPYEGAPSGRYVRAVESLSESLQRHNAVVIELGDEDEAVMRCGLELVRMFFKGRAQCGVKSSRGFYIYHAGR